MTTLGEALLEVKTLKSELSRLHQERENGFKFRVQPNAVVDAAAMRQTYIVMSADITDAALRLRKLKTRIENTNHATFIDTDEGKMTIAETIMKIGDMRSELACLETLRAKFKEEESWRLSSTDPSYGFQLSQKELLAFISGLESKKSRLDGFLSSMNWKVELI